MDVAEERLRAARAAAEAATFARSILPKLDWDAEKRGPLLIVNPGAVRLTGPRRPDGSDDEDAPPPSPAMLPAPGPRGYNLASVAPLFRQRLVRLPTLTALAPTEAPIIPPRIGPEMLPFSASDMRDPGSALLVFLGSLTEAQWRQAGSDAGIGRDDLTPRQYPAFEAILPPDAALLPNPEGSDPATEPNGATREPRPIPLSPALRSRLRVRVQRRYALSYILATSEVAGRSGGFNEAPTRFSLTGEPHKEAKPDLVQPNRLKTGEMDMDYAPFARPISLNGLKTVGDVMKRISDVTGIELHADVRVARLPVVTRGDQANASDLLKGLCWALASTFRRMETDGKTFFLLTFDVEPLGRQLSRVTDSMVDSLLPVAVSAGGQRRAGMAASHRIFAVRPFRFLGVGRSLLPVARNAGTRDERYDWIPFTPPVSASRLIRPDLAGEAPPSAGPPGTSDADMPTPPKPAPKDDDSPDVMTIPTGELSDDARRAVTEMIALTNQRRNGPSKPGIPFRTDKVGVQVAVYIEFELPGFGVVARQPMPTIRPAPAPPKPEELALPQGNRAVTLAVSTPEEARRAVTAARERGFTAVWFSLPDNLSASDETKVMTEGIATAREKKAANGKEMAVVAIVSVLGRTPPDKPDGQSDLTSAGSSAAVWAAQRSRSPLLRDLPAFRTIVFAQNPDWLLPDSPAAVARVGRIARLAGTPGLAGIAFKNLVPSALSGGPFASLSGGREMDGILVADVGFTPAFRASFARRNDLDPADLPLPAISALLWGMGNHPMIYLSPSAPNGRGDASGVVTAWLQERWKPTAVLLARLHGEVTRRRPELPLFVSLGNPIEGNNSWATWDRADRIPGIVTAPPTPNTPDEGGEEPASPDQPLRRNSRTIYRALPYGSYLFRREVETNSESVAEDEDPRTAFARFLSSEVGPLRRAKKSPWDGIALGLDTLPLDAALSLLEVLPTPNPPAP